MSRALIVLSIAAGLCLFAGTAGGQSGCPDADARPGTASRARMASALECLIDQRRDSDGLSGFQTNARLRSAAAGHAHDMLVHGFFGHSSSNGANVADRARAAGYTRGAHRWQVGEALEWGQSSRATPRAALRSLMASPPHRAILMSHSFRDVGIATVTYRRSGRRAATYVVDAGRRG